MCMCKKMYQIACAKYFGNGYEIICFGVSLSVCLSIGLSCRPVYVSVVHDGCLLFIIANSFPKLRLNFDCVALSV